MPVRSTSALSVSAARSTGCQSLSLPLRFPSGVRMASTMTAVVMSGLLLGPLAMLAPGRKRSVCCWNPCEPKPERGRSPRRG